MFTWIPVQLATVSAYLSNKFNHPFIRKHRKSQRAQAEQPEDPRGKTRLCVSINYDPVSPQSIYNKWSCKSLFFCTVISESVSVWYESVALCHSLTTSRCWNGGWHGINGCDQLVQADVSNHEFSFYRKKTWLDFDRFWLKDICMSFFSFFSNSSQCNRGCDLKLSKGHFSFQLNFKSAVLCVQWAYQSCFAENTEMGDDENEL